MRHDPRKGCGGARDTEALRLPVELGTDTLRTLIVARFAEASTRQRRPREHRDPVLHGEVERAVRERLEHQRRELRLNACKRNVQVCDERRRLRRREVGNADRPGLAARDERFKGSRHLRGVRQHVWSVHLEQIEVVGAESMQRGLAGGDQIGRRWNRRARPD